MANAEHLKTIIHDITPTLEKVLATDSYTSAIPENLQLRYTQCGLGTAALQAFLLDRFDIKTERVINRLTEAPRGPNFRIESHVVLRTDEHVIDPTYGQFMNYIGLTHRSAVEHDIAHLYPSRKIMVYGTENARAFADTFARHAFQIDQNNLVPRPLIEYVPDGQLRGAPLDELQRVYRSIWDSNNYAPFPIEDQNEGMQKAAKRVNESIKSLVSSR